VRISTDPADPSYLDGRPRRVTVNDLEVSGWHTADEFRRVVILKDGKVLHGSVWIERLSEDKPEPPAPAPAAPIDAGFSGVFVPAATPAPTSAPVQIHEKHEPGRPDLKITKPNKARRR
jgi:hypothetical protein